MSKQAYLRAMGIQAYRLRGSAVAEPADEEVVESARASAQALTAEVVTSTKTEFSVSPESSISEQPAAPQAQSVPPSSDNDLMSYMMMDESIDDDEQQDFDDFPQAVPSQPGVASLDWPQLQQRISECQLCGLCESRSNTVFGVGNPDADVMVIGEAPGADEDAAGEPFVGAAGQLLDNMLKAIGLDRKKVFIANILKCRPPANRNPHVEEVLACEPYLKRQIELINPKLILSVGGVSAHNLLKTEENVGRLRQQVHQLPGSDLPVHVTYHPAYLLRKPSEKAKSWVDLKKFALAMDEIS